MLSPLTPVAVALINPVQAGAASFQIVLRKVTSTGQVTDLGTFTFGPGVAAQVLPITASFNAHDALAVYQVGGTTSTGGANITLTAALYGSEDDAA